VRFEVLMAVIIKKVVFGFDVPGSVVDVSSHHYHIFTVDTSHYRFWTMSVLQMG
jgi:hypothetical protein